MTLNQEIVIVAQLSVDGKGFKRVGTAHTAWDSTADFLDPSNTPPTRRHEGMVGWIRSGSDIEMWHFVGGITDDKFIKYILPSGTSIVTEIDNSLFPSVGLDDVIYINTTTLTPYVWLAGSYQVIGNPGPTGAKGDPGNVGPANSLTIGTVTTGGSSSATITGSAPSQTLNLVLQKGDAGADGTSGLALRTNGATNGVQNVLDVIDSNTISPEYVGTGQLKLNTLSRVLVSVKVGTSEATAAGIIAGDSTYTNSRLSGQDSECFRGGALIPDFDLGGGTENAILTGTTITFSSVFYTDEWIKIKIA